MLQSINLSGRIDILTIMSIPVHEHGMSFQLYRISFINTVNFQQSDLVHILLDLYLSIFWYYYKQYQIFKKIQFTCSLLVYRNTVAVELGTLTLYSMTLLQSPVLFF